MAKPEMLRNTVTYCLDGPPELALVRYQSIIGHAREFCRQRGIRVDISDLFREGREVFTTPPTGTFYLTLKYLGRFITLVFHAKDWWLVGWFGENGCYETILDGQDDKYMIQEDCTKLNFRGNYGVICPSGVEATWVGLDALREAYETLWAYNGGKEPKSMRRCYSVMVLYFSEALRLMGVYNTMCKAFTDPQVARLCSHSSHVSWSNKDWINSWRFFSREGMQYIAEMKAGHNEPEFNNRGIVGITSVVAVLHEIRVFYIGAFARGPFRHEQVSSSLIYAEPIDTGEGDPEINLTVKSEPTRERKMSESSDKNENKKGHQKKKKITDSLASVRRNRYLGGGVGGPPGNFPPSILLPCLPLPIQDQNASDDSTVNAFSSVSGQKRHLSTAVTPSIAPNGYFCSVGNPFLPRAAQRNFSVIKSPCVLPIVQNYRQNQFCSVNGKMLSASTGAFKREVCRSGYDTGNHNKVNRNWLTTTCSPKVPSNNENIFRRQINKFSYQTEHLSLSESILNFLRFVRRTVR